MPTVVILTFEDKQFFRVQSCCQTSQEALEGTTIHPKVGRLQNLILTFQGRKRPKDEKADDEVGQAQNLLNMD